MHASWTADGQGVLCFTIRADRFLRNMVRSLVGTLVDVILGFLLMLFILGAFFYQMFFSQPYLIPLILLFVAACFILEFFIRKKLAK